MQPGTQPPTQYPTNQYPTNQYPTNQRPPSQHQSPGWNGPAGWAPPNHGPQPPSPGTGYGEPYGTSHPDARRYGQAQTGPHRQTSGPPDGTSPPLAAPPTNAWVPPQGAPAGTLPAKRLNPYPAMLVTLALVTALTVFASMMPALRTPERPQAAASRWLGTDGHGEWLFGDAKAEPLYLETAHYQGVPAFLSSGIDLVVGLGDPDQIRERNWIFERWTEGSNVGERLLSPDERGMVEFGSTDRGIRTRWSGRIVLPTDPRPGASWTTKGTVSTLNREGQQDGTFTTKGSLTDAGGGCLGVRLEEQRVLGGRTSTVTEEHVRCPGRGIVADGQRGLKARAGFPADQDPRRQVRTTGTAFSDSVTPEVRTPTTPTGSRLTLRVLAGFAPTDIGGVVSSALSNDLLSLSSGQQKSDRALSLYNRHPGGTVRTISGYGQVFVAGTTLRQLVAYDLIGRRLWTVETDDVIRQIMRYDDTRLVALTVTGSVLVISIADGQVVWQSSFVGQGADQILVAPTSGGRTLLVATQTGLVALDGAGRTAWTLAGDRPEQLAAAGNRAVVADSEGLLFGIDLSNGSVVWHQRRPKDVWRTAFGLGRDHVVLAGASRTLVLRAADGTRTQQLTGSVLSGAPLGRPTGSPARGVLLTGDSWLVIEPDKVVAGAKHPAGFSRIQPLLQTDGHTVALDNKGAALFWGRPS